MSMPDHPYECIRARLISGLFISLLSITTHDIKAAPEGPRLGQPLSAEALARIEPTIFPDGRGLPTGKGSAAEGKLRYESQCLACHGPEGQGGSGGELVGKSPLNGPHPDQTVGNYWPYATTLFDFIRRSMPLNAPRSLSDADVYALTAYLLALNGVIAHDHEVNAKTLPEIKMPNRDGFTRIWPQSN